MSDVVKNTVVAAVDLADSTSAAAVGAVTEIAELVEGGVTAATKAILDEAESLRKRFMDLVREAADKVIPPIVP